MLAGGAKAELLQQIRRHLCGMDLRESERARVSRHDEREELSQARSVVLDEAAERQKLPAWRLEKIGLDALVGGDGEPCRCRPSAP